MLRPQPHCTQFRQPSRPAALPQKLTQRRLLISHFEFLIVYLTFYIFDWWPLAPRAFVILSVAKDLNVYCEP